ncbi:putative reverse transcriptase domain-containing protein, partial [Tanacetum coccineum]
ALQALPSPNYVPGPEEPEQAPPSPDYLPRPEYLDYLALSDAKILIEDQPHAADASPTTLSLGYIADSNPEKDPEDDSGRLYCVSPVVDHVPSPEETEPFKTDESAATPPPPPPAYRTTTRMSTTSLQTQLIAALGRIDTLEARETAHTDDPEDADSCTSTAKMPPRKGTRTRTIPAIATTPMTNAANKALVAQGVADALAEQTIKRNTNLNGDGSQGSESGITRLVRLTRECTYSDFLKCQPLNFKVKNQVKFATCTLHGISLTWWNTHVKTVGHDAAYGNVMSTKPKTIEEAIEMANNLMDQKLRTLAECQIENKRKQDDNFRDNQNQQQLNKRQNTGKAYIAWPSEKREYGGSLPKCSKCNYHHNGQCAPKCHKCNKVGHLAWDCRSSGNANA